jgi:hypothetical protein
MTWSTTPAAFAARKTEAEAWEAQVAFQLQTQGWLVERFGQGLWSQGMHDLLMHTQAPLGGPNLIRWLPDLLAVKRHPNGSVQSFFVEVKNCKGARHAIEERSVRCAELLQALGTPVIFVFEDWHVLTAEAIRYHGRQGPVRSQGSGTPYLLVERSQSWPWFEVFSA